MELALIGLGFALVLEGVLYAALPLTMRRVLIEVLKMPEGQMRVTGLVAAFLGLLIIWLAQG